MVAPQLAAGAERRYRNQVDLKRTTGFPGGNADVGHAVLWALRKSYSLTTAQVAAHLAAVPGAYNFQGNRRLAFWTGRSERTVRRARAELERDGLVRSFLLLPGDQISGQKAPVTRPQVVRDVAQLQRLARGRGAVRPPHQRSSSSSRPSAADVPRQAATADELDAVARNADPELARHISAIAAAKRAREEKPDPVLERELRDNPAPAPEQIDQWERLTAAMEQELERDSLIEWYAKNGLDPPDSLN